MSSPQVGNLELGLAVGQLRQYAARAIAALAPYDAVLTPTLATHEKMTWAIGICQDV